MLHAVFNYPFLHHDQYASMFTKSLNDTDDCLMMIMIIIDGYICKYSGLHTFACLMSSRLTTERMFVCASGGQVNIWCRVYPGMFRQGPIRDLVMCDYPLI